MITWFVGDNSFEVYEALHALEARFDGTSERIDATTLTLNQLPELLMGVSLFSTDRLVIISDISQNTALWEKLPDWLARVSDTIHVVFVDTKPDKRTTSYKALKAAATIHEFPSWSERDVAKATQWVSARASSQGRGQGEGQGLQLDRPIAAHLVSRVGLDQWQLAHAIENLALLDTVSIAAIDAIIPPNPQENIFQLFETALSGDAVGIAQMLATLRLQQDPYALFALLSSQATTLAAVTFATDTVDAVANPAKDFAIHPFVASKLARHGERLGKARVGQIIEVFADTDAGMKRSRGEPWLLIERALLEVAIKK